VHRGGADKIFFNTSRVGVIESPVRISASRARVGDKVILNDLIGDHGTTIMIARGELGLDPLYMANEGRQIAVGAVEIADAIVVRLRKYPRPGRLRHRLSEGRAARHGHFGRRSLAEPE